MQNQINNLNHNDKIRKEFSIKVYGILFVKLLITFIIIFLFNFNEIILVLLIDNMGFFLVAFLINFFSIFYLVNSSYLKHKVPINYIFLFVYTISFSFLCSLFCLIFSIFEILFAFFLTIFIFIILTFISKKTFLDLTKHYKIITIFLTILVIGSIIEIFFNNKLFQSTISFLISILFNIFIMLYTQLLFGKHLNKVNIDSYIVVTINLYIDIMRLFLIILKALNNIDSNKCSQNLLLLALGLSLQNF